MSLECFLKPWKMRQNNELHADLASFFFNCVRKKNAFLGVRAEILLFFLAQLNKKLAKSACNSLFCLIFHGLRKYSRDTLQQLQYFCTKHSKLSISAQKNLSNNAHCRLNRNIHLCSQMHQLNDNSTGS